MDLHLSGFKQFTSVCSPRIREEHGEKIQEAAVKQASDEFTALAPQVPFIGGKDNPGTITLIQSSWFLALYRSLNRLTSVPGTNRRLLYGAGTAWFLKRPAIYCRMIGKIEHGAWAFRKWERLAERSQRREYPEDWVFNTVKGDGKEFDWGIDYTECAILKFFSAQGSHELTPVMCLLDFPISQAYGSGLRRTEALAMGGSRCDFRFKPGRPADKADIDKL